MQLSTYSICRQREGWQPVEILSSKGDKTYLVLVNPWGATEENICCCESYNYRGHCRHQQQAQDNICTWDSRFSDRQMGPYDSCPHCGGPTKVEIEVG